MFRLTASAKFRSVKSLVCLDSSHSQTTITFQPNASSAATSCASLSLLRRIFSCQNSTFDRGILNLSHPGCPCQKHPFMNITVWYLLSTMSGHPGSFLECNEYLNPSECSHLRTTISGRVSFPLIRDIQLCRCSRVIVSDISLRRSYLRKHEDNNINDSEERNSWTITLWESKKDLQKREYVKITPAL